MLGATLLGVAVVGAVRWPGMRDEARRLAAASARDGCMCRLVAARPLADCQAEHLTGHGPWGLPLAWHEIGPPEPAIIAEVPLMARERARLRPGWGCQLDPWNS